MSVLVQISARQVSAGASSASQLRRCCAGEVYEARRVHKTPVLKQPQGTQANCFSWTKCLSSNGERDTGLTWGEGS